MPISMATGQAAGVCAALASTRGDLPRDVPVGTIQQELRAQGASLR
ncbi:FAD-dependent oxidoreductase [Streptomyces cinereoruber]